MHRKTYASYFSYGIAVFNPKSCIRYFKYLLKTLFTLYGHDTKLLLVVFIEPIHKNELRNFFIIFFTKHNLFALPRFNCIADTIILYVNITYHLKIEPMYFIPTIHIKIYMKSTIFSNKALNYHTNLPTIDKKDYDYQFFFHG